MKLLSAVAAALLPLTALAAKASDVDRFESWHTQQLSKGGTIRLNDASYDDLLKAPRNYSVAVLLTALDARFQCAVCRDFQPEWEVLAKSWVKGDKAGESKVIFGTLDFLEGKNTFQSFALQTAPVLFLFQPTTGPHASTDQTPARFDFSTGTEIADPVHAWLTRQLPDRPHPRLVRPFNWLRLTLITTTVLGIISFFSIAAPVILPVIQNRNLWAAVSLIAVLMFTSGHMYNHIRKVPYVAQDGKGGVSYFAGGFQNQFGLESQIVAAMYGILSFATISLALKVPRMTNPRAQQVAVFVWGGVLLGMYSFLLSVFRIKNGGYPFWLPPF